MSRLPTITEERQSTSTSHKPLLCATFDFSTFSLGTQLLSIDELRYQKRHLSSNNTITNYAVTEYTNSTKHTTITIINLSPHQCKKFLYAKIPTLNNIRALYLHKLHTNDNKYYLHISFSNKYSPKKYKNVNINNLIAETSNIPTIQLLPLSFNGMALAIIYKQMPNTNNNIIDGILYHKHNTKIYKHFNKQNKREAVIQNNITFDSRSGGENINIYKPNKKNRIKSLSHLNAMQKNSYKLASDGTKNTKKKRRKSKVNGENMMLSLQKSHSRSISNSSIASVSSMSSVFDVPLDPVNEC